MKLIGVECWADKYFFEWLLNDKSIIRKESNDDAVIEGVVTRSKGNFSVGIVDVDKDEKIPTSFTNIDKNENTQIFKQKIEELKNQLKESKKHYQFELICTSEFSDKMIGFFNIRNVEKILTLLNNGSKLQYRHGVFGDVDVCMNPQRNRILVSENTGNWYLNMEI